MIGRTICALALVIAPILARSQDVIYINDNNKEQSSPPTKSFQYVREVRLMPGFSVSGSSGAWYARPYDPVNAPQTLDRNFVRVETLLDKVSNESLLSGLPVDTKQTNYSYFDGLGRQIQQVAVQGSPGKRDVVQEFDTDGFGGKRKQFLNYTTNNRAGQFRSNAESEIASFYSSPPIGVAQESLRPFSEDHHEFSPLNRVLKTFGPGNDWYATNHGVEPRGLLNNANDVLEWSFNGPNPPTLASPNPPVLKGFYPVNLLSVEQVTDEQGLIKKTYKNVFGQVVLERTGQGQSWHDTYYIYDWSGKPFCVIPPEASARAAHFDAGLSTWVFTYKDAMSNADRQSLLDDWAFQYGYDAFERMIWKKIPGSSSWHAFVYDPWDRLVLSQDGNLKEDNKWTFTKYDEFNRPIITGFYSSSASQASLQSTVDAFYATNATQKRFEIRNASNALGYTLDKSFPANPSESDMLTITYYDDHAFKDYPGWNEGTSYSYVSENGLPASSELPSTVKGYSTGSKIKNLGNGEWLNNVSYYDKKYNVIQVISENHLHGTDRISSQVDFAGRVIQALRTHTSDFDSFSLLEENDYDHGGRLLKTFHTLDGGARVLIASNTYNELGQLVEKNLHSVSDSPFLQSIDYSYNIRGWLTHINNSSLTADAHNNDSEDLFGVELFYNNPAPAVNGQTPEALYGGNIAAVRWQSTNLIDQPKEKIFGFTHDAWNRLSSAKYATKSSGTYSGDAGLFDNSYGYDLNGNLSSLARYGNTASGPQKIDELEYGYEKGNRLKYVNDQTAYNTVGTEGYGFTEHSDLTIKEYDYDPNGNVIVDMNKGIDVTYNHLNMPVTIAFSGGSIQYTYDALGNKIKQVVVKGSQQIVERDYIGGVHYEDSQLRFVTNKEGRAIKDGSNWFYEYQLRDHQNNTMVSFGALEESNVYKATMETSPSTVSIAEEGDFRNIAGRRDNAFNHTSATAEMPSPIYSAWANGSVTNKEIGPAKVLDINSGDRLKMQVQARYVTPSSNANSDVLGNLVDITTSALGISSGEAAYAAFNDNIMAATSAVTSNSGSPKVYLNYILFNGNFSAYQFGYVPVSTIGAVTFEQLSMEITIPSGYSGGIAYIYVTNESNYSAYFDDMLIVHEKTNLVPQVTQQTDYYPFGVRFNSYVKEAIRPNRYLYQDQELQDDLGLDGYQFKLRMHDASIGRFASVDPLAENFRYNSSYSFSENNVIDAIELEGAERLGFMDHWNMNSQWGAGQLPASLFTYSYDWMTSGYINFGLGGRNLIANEIQHSQNLRNPYFDSDAAQMQYALKGAEALTQTVQGAAQIMNVNSTLTGLALGGVQSTFTFNSVSRGFVLGGSESLFGENVLAQSSKNFSLLKNTLPVSREGKLLGSISNGKIAMNGSTMPAGRFDFVVMQDGQILLGRKHTFLSGGADVFAAGELKIRGGYIVDINNLSGHYVPSIQQSRSYLNIFNSFGADVSKSHLTIYNNGRIAAHLWPQ